MNMKIKFPSIKTNENVVYIAFSSRIELKGKIGGGCLVLVFGVLGVWGYLG
jgi:hypothetical protein